MPFVFCRPSCKRASLIFTISACWQYNSWAATAWRQGCMTVRKICSRKLVDETDLTGAAACCRFTKATSDWQKAIDTAERLVKLGKDKQRVEIAHFTANWSLQQMGNDDMDKAMALLEKGGRRRPQ